MESASKTIPTIVTMLLVVLAGWQTDKTTRFVFTDASALWVTGTSSLHDWQCDAAQISGWLDAELGDKVTSITASEINVLANALECKNGTMDKKTQKALRAEEYPNISFKLSQAQVVKDSSNTFTLATTGQLTVAGVTQTVSMTVAGQLTNDGQIQLAGSLPITMTAFDIKPPTAMLGTLKTGDEITVHFEATAKRASDP